MGNNFLVKSFRSAVVAAFMLFPSVSKSDILTVITNPSSLPYALNPSNYNNSPSNYTNSSSNYRNSVSNYKNSPSNYANSMSNYANRAGGGRNLFDENRRVIGYYVFGDDGIINFYNYNSRRVAYLPSGGHTRSLFSENGWCGTLGDIRGDLALGLTQSCYLEFVLQN